VSNSSEWDLERFIEELAKADLNRRTLLRRAGAGALGLSFAGFLAACGGDDDNNGDEAKVIPKGEIADRLNFSNWPYYIDDPEGKRHPTLERFERKYDTTVKYTEEINDNVEFFGKVRQLYDRGDSGGRDLHVVTDWMCNRMKQLGYVQKLDKSAMPNVVKNIEPAVAHPDFDPNREFSVPWQSGQVILIFRKDKVGEIKNVNDLFDPKLKGKVTVLSEMRDTVGSVLLASGVEPEKASLDQAMAVIEKVEKAANDGQIRRFTGNEYTRDLLKGDSHAVLGWSGDAVSLTVEDENIGYNQPEDGFMIFTDSMQIPVGAPHAYTAEKFMDFVYDPEIAADLAVGSNGAIGVNYVPPVKGAKEVLLERDPKAGSNELIFPDLTNAHNFKSFPIEEEQEIDAAFQRAQGA
jgi:spermidine/putrescine transport system substrate-binding protein